MEMNHKNTDWNLQHNLSFMYSSLRQKMHTTIILHVYHIVTVQSFKTPLVIKLIIQPWCVTIFQLFYQRFRIHSYMIVFH